MDEELGEGARRARRGDAPMSFDAVWRAETPNVLGALVRRYGDFGACEDAVQEALAAAAEQWPTEGVPERPRAWLIRVASRRLIDRQRADRSRASREQLAHLAAAEPPHHGPADEPMPGDHDDTLALLALCCHPSLTTAGQVALTLRAVAGLRTAQIATAFLVPEATMGQRISRAKATLRDVGDHFDGSPTAALDERLDAVRHVLYLVFNEGYTASDGDALVVVSLTSEAIRVTRQLLAATPADAETSGLLALMLLSEAHVAARTDERGDLVPLAEQDRTRWDAAMVVEGVDLVERALPLGDVGPFQLQAAIAAVHAEATNAGATDWRQIVVLYEMLERVAPGPVVTLNRAVAVAMVDGPAAGLALVDPLLGVSAMSRHHRTHAVRAHLLDLAGRPADAVEAYRIAARLTHSTPEQRYLEACARRAVTVAAPGATAMGGSADGGGTVAP